MSAIAPPPPTTAPLSSQAGSAASDDRAHISRVPYLPGLDGMRAIAVVAVMIYHANSDWLPGGFLGVEMFFVISGYLITLLLISERERNYSISLRNFWLRRARRLLPALFTMMILVTAWTAIFKNDALGQLRGDVVAGFFYVSNWYQIWTGLGYTAAGDFAPLRHLWSLAVEEQFYVFWPIVMVVLLGRAGTRRVADVSRWLFITALVITAAVAVLFYSGPIGDPDVTPDAYWWLGDRPINKIDTLYLGTVSRLSGILLGAAFAMVWRPFAIVRGPLRSKGRWFDALALIALVFFGWMCWSVYLATPSGADPFLFRGGMFLVSLATLMVIAAVTHRGAWSNRLLGNPLLLWIGTRSYGLYLYHWPIYQMIRDVAGNKLTLVEFAFAMLLTVIVTEASYRFIETPIRTGRFRAGLGRFRRGAARGPKLAAFGGVAVASALALFAGIALATAPLQQNEIAEALDAGTGFTTDLSSARTPVASTTTTTTTTTTTVAPPPSAPAVATGSTVPGSPTPSVPPTTVPPATVPPTTVPPTTVATVEPVASLGVVSSLQGLAPLAIEPTPGGFPRVALGDSVMLGAAEELQANGFQVDALKSRQMKDFLPTMQLLQTNGTYGSVVVIHLGTNGGFSQATLDQMLATVADVPVVLLLTAEADRSWVADNNAKIRAVPASHANVTVVDWEVLSASCPGRCFYDDGIHLTQSGQDYYADVIETILAP